MVGFLNKAFLFVVQPGNLWVLVLGAGALLLFTRWRRLGRLLVLAAAVLGFTVALVPVGDFLLWPLEERFSPLADLPPKVDGIIILGGAIDTEITLSRHQPKVNEHAERVFAFVDLARRYPQAKLIFANSGPDLANGNFSEADAAREVFQALGMDTGRIVFERESHGPFEQVVDSKALAHPAPGEIWMLITSAFQMPHAVALFRAQGWPVVADPVDYQTKPPEVTSLIGLHIDENLRKTSLAVKEWVSLLTDRLLGRSHSLLPSP
jgi:uncharacterized SAM-binding protein YcdF (DUF218 family)